MQTLPGPLKAGLAVEVDRLDDQGVALPVPTRIPLPLADRVIQMRTPVQGDDANLVDLLGQNRHVTGMLEQSLIVVAARHHRRSGPLLVDTPLPQGPILNTRRGTGHDRTAIGHTLLRCGRQGRELPIWRVHDQRSALGADDLGPSVPPELVVGSGKIARLHRAIDDSPSHLAPPGVRIAPHPRRA